MNLLITLVLTLSIGMQTIANAADFEDSPELRYCAMQEGVTEDMLDNEPDNYKVKCFYLCELTRIHIIENGKIVDPDRKEKPVSPNVSGLAGNQKLRHCFNLKEQNECELGNKLYNCLHDELDKAYEEYLETKIFVKKMK
ncbi:uncharacterized protein LOC108106551 [Drosophila eugracilis]|uniref:uncharacterized protein LOC108106551 n=1 Tax=Drosophila eugracilis TaxID=29029 RepID=UPI0007E87A92|nr:uncharacterized protein LOC108106551 [Drosophila eugracilis]